MQASTESERTDSESVSPADKRQQYRQLISKREDLQQERHHCQLAFTSFVLNPPLLSDEQLREYRDRYRETGDQLDDVAKEMALLLQDEALREQLGREYGIGNVDNDNRSPWELTKSAPVFLAEEDKEFSGLVRDLVFPGAVTLVAAPRGLGKTQTAHAIAVALALAGIFRGQQLQPTRVLLLDRDNPESLVKKRLRSWGAAEAHNLRVLTRQNAPDLRDKKAWQAFPVNNYDVLMVDSIGASTDGVTEKEGKQTTEVLATILDLARTGLAILLLQNTTKDGVNIRGRGEWMDRADVVFEVRDATGVSPSGKKAWWQELPEAGEAAWAERAARRKGRIDFRLAFVPSKFRLGVEPEPFCLELYLPQGAPWMLRDVTTEINQAAEEALAQEKRGKAEHLKTAAEKLLILVAERASQGDPVLKTEAERFLCEIQLLKRTDARQLLKDSPLWRLEKSREGDGKQAAWCVLPQNLGNGKTHESRASEDPFVAAQAGSGRQRHMFVQPAIDAGFKSTEFVAEEGCVENAEDGNELENALETWEDEL